MTLRFARQFPWLALFVAAVAVADTTPHATIRTSDDVGRAGFTPAVLKSEAAEPPAEARQVSYVSNCASNGCNGCDRCSQCCPRCQERCFVDISKEDVKKHTWDIECEKICVPRVSFPWQLSKSKHACPGCGKSCCDRDAVCSCGCPQPAKCAKVRTVRKLVKHEYTCKKCKYTWTVKTVACGNCGSGKCSGGCVNNAANAKANVSVAKSRESSPQKPVRTARHLRTKDADATLIPRGATLPPLPR